MANELIDKAKIIRREIIELAYKTRCSHIGCCLSIVDILTALYFKLLKSGDKFILSKGHGALALYVTLSERGIIPKGFLCENFYVNGGIFAGHPELNTKYGIEATTGSLGHGLPIGCGMALVNDSRIVVLISDGELEEGSNWEAIMFASTHRLSNLVVFVDYNKLQAFGRTNEIVNLEPLVKRLEDFGWRVITIDGHDIEDILHSFELLSDYKPTIIIANTKKGNGISFMEDKLEWHYKSLDAATYQQAREELK